MRGSCCSIRGWLLALVVGVGVKRRGSSEDGLARISRQAQETNVGSTEKVGQLVLCGI